MGPCRFLLFGVWFSRREGCCGGRLLPPIMRKKLAGGGGMMAKVEAAGDFVI